MTSPMPVYCPFTAGKLRESVVRALVIQRPDVRWVALPSGEPYAYASLLTDLWARNEPFILCEQDVLPPAGALHQLEKCEAAWCTHGLYVGSHVDYRTLGLVKFGPALLYTHPNLMRQALWVGSTRGPSTPWELCDTQLARILEHFDLQPHVHQPDAIHLHRYPQAV